jgi:hypothetical protein
MFQLGKTIVSDEILEKEFICNLGACKGACCVNGDAGAPLEKEELKILEEIQPIMKKYLRGKGLEAIDRHGPYTTNEDGEHETTLINGEDCAYVIYDKNNIALCGIEEAYNQGEITFKKPVSCHLYPIRIRQYSEFAAVNYDRWDICDDACTLGKEMKVPVFKFVKQALVRKFGQEWYDELEKINEEREFERNK